MLKKISNLMSHDGLLLILVPNFKSLATKIIREKSPTFNWKHVSYFSVDSLNSLVKSCGFDLIHCETVISEIDNIKSYLNGKHPYQGYGDPKNIFEFITPEFIHSNLLGSRILSIYKKLKIKLNKW